MVNELDSTVSALHRDGDRFRVAGQASTVPAAALPAVPGPDNMAAALRVSPSGRHVLASNRGHDSLAVLRFEPGTATLSPVSTAASAGTTPRDFIITPDGRHVIVAGQDNDVLATYAFDDDAGALRLLHTVIAPTPVCLTLA